MVPVTGVTFAVADSVCTLTRKVAVTSFFKKTDHSEVFLQGNAARSGCREKKWVKLPIFSSFRLRHANVCLLITDTIIPIHRDWKTRGSRFG
jgi:hypothetical protein